MAGDSGLQAVAFSSALEGFGRAFRARIPAATLDELRGLGLDFDHLQPAYPLQTWEQTVRVVARALFPEAAPEEGWHRLGREFVPGYSETLLGRAILGMAKVVGPRRFMERIGRNLRTGGNFAVVRCRGVGANEVELDSSIDAPFLAEWAGRELVMHRYRQGIFEGALEAIGVQGAVERVEMDRQRQAARYRVRWP
jgi:uncharacterized protein (TIGR02265 family)